MAIGDKTKKKDKIKEHLFNRILDDELSIAKSNQEIDDLEFEGYVDLLDSIRSEKEYDWMSDVRIPEFASRMLTQSSIDVDQYFQTRDFVEVYIEDEGDEAIANANASKELINRTLNRKDLYHYPKYVRARNLCNLSGKVYAMCQWEQETRVERGTVDTETQFEELDVDVFGKPITDLDIQVPGMNVREVPIEGDITNFIRDGFSYEILDPRNVFTDNKYVYSLQDKDWVFVRSEETLEDLKRDERQNGYINLDNLENIKSDGETETSVETYNKDEGHLKPDRPVNRYFDIFTRFGKYWCKVTDKDDNGEPTKVEPGINKSGKIMKDAEFLEVIISFAVKDSNRELIRFQLQPYMDANGKRYRPIIRGLCYIHPTDDGGIGDGKYAKELQIAIDDTINISNDRVMLATLMTLVAKKYASEDNSTLRLEPGNIIEVEDPQTDIRELGISDNIGGAMTQYNVLSNAMDKAMAVFPTTMGDLPGFSSTTATAIAGAEQRTNTRSNYKSLTFENTFLADFYWMIQQMTAQFAQPETGEKLMGDKVFDFDPSRDYYYKPVSQSIESEQSKGLKVNKWKEMLGMIIQIQHPDTVRLVNHILTKMFTYMGDEFVNFGNKLLNPRVPIQQAGAGGVEGGIAELPPGNEQGIPQSGLEQGVREVAGGEF